MRFVLWLILALLGWGGFEDLRGTRGDAGEGTGAAPAAETQVTVMEGGAGKPPCCEP